MAITDEEAKRQIPGLLRAAADKLEHMDSMPTRKDEGSFLLFTRDSRVNDHETGQTFFGTIFVYLSESKNGRDEWANLIERNMLD